MGCGPGERADVLRLACPDTSVAVPRALDPSKNVTGPVGAPTLPHAGATFPVKVTFCPTIAGLTKDVSEVVVAATEVGVI